MNRDIEHKLIEAMNEQIELIEPSKTSSYASLLKKIGNARFVMIGEASHGTEEFYQTRIDITKELITKKGFMAVAIEGDWPDTYLINQFVQGSKEQNDLKKALSGFNRFPMWMWRNTTIPPFMEWLREYNINAAHKYKIGFYGLDLYSLNKSIEAVVKYLEKMDPKACEEAKMHYSCFDHISVDPQMYGYLTNTKVKKSCIEEVIKAFSEIQHQAYKYINGNEEDYFCAMQNARVIKNAEEYYRSMYEDHISSWNVRDRHMTETLNILADHLEHKYNQPAKIVIWAHNSHLGDARATEMGEKGEINIGQLVREQHTDTYSIGFSTYEGMVTAASNWDEPAEFKKIVPGMKGSFEELFHELKYKNFILNLTGNEKLDHYLKLPRLQRAIGVIYRPESERYSHYFFSHLPYQFDSIIHFDSTNPVKPLN